MTPDTLVLSLCCPRMFQEIETREILWHKQGRVLPMSCLKISRTMVLLTSITTTVYGIKQNNADTITKQKNSQKKKEKVQMRHTTATNNSKTR